MSGDLWLCRVRLRRDAPVNALAALLRPAGESSRIAATHRLIWTLFADSPDRRRDFLWREAGEAYFILSRRLPADPHRLFDIDPPKPFAPKLQPGNRLAFVLRANATLSKAVRGARGRRSDVVMDAIHDLPAGSRAEARREAMVQAGLAWLNRQAEKSGFVLPDGSAGVQGYRILRLERRGPDAKVGVLDYEGWLEVHDPDAFLRALATGFGRAKAFGCGLMLIRRRRM